MWHWARDQELVNKFEKIRTREIIVLIFFVATQSLALLPDFLQPLTWMAVAILCIVRLDIFSFKLHFRRTPLADIRFVDKKMWMILGSSMVLYISVLVIFPDSFPKIYASARNMCESITLSNELFKILHEEILFRLALYYSLNRLFGRNVSFWATLFFFAFRHDHNVHIYYPLAVIPAGILLSLVTILTGSLVPALLLHFILNILVYIFVIYISPFVM